MFLMAYLGDTPVMGLSGCVLHDPFTAFDALLPRLIAGEKITRADIMAMGHGGLAKTRSLKKMENGKSRIVCPDLEGEVSRGCFTNLERTMRS